jgi:protein TonB
MNRVPQLLPVAATRPLHRMRWLALAIAAASVLAGCGDGGEPAPAPKPAPAAAPAVDATTPAAPAGATAELAPPAASVDELLKKARQALTDQHLVTPPGDNAIEYYLQVLAQEPANMQATQALVDVFPLAASSAERALAQRQVAEAERIIGLLDRVDAKSYTVASLRTKLGTAQAQQQREEQAQAQQTAQATQAAAAQAAAVRAAAAGAASEAPPPTAAPAGEVAAAPPAARPPAPAAPVTATPAAPVDSAAQPPRTAPATAGLTRDARPLRQVPPEYPVDAARKRQEGWVELEFSVAADGQVRNVAVLRAQPARVFDREAVRAMQQWTFEPALRDGQPIESRGRRRIEFQL